MNVVFPDVIFKAGWTLYYVLYYARVYLWWSLCILYRLACQARVTVGDSGHCCCVCVMSFANPSVCWHYITHIKKVSILNPLEIWVKPMVVWIKCTHSDAGKQKGKKTQEQFAHQLKQWTCFPSSTFVCIKSLEYWIHLRLLCFIIRFMSYVRFSLLMYICCEYVFSCF